MLKQSIDAGYPALAALNTYNIKDNEEVEESAHMTVAYGYQNISYEKQENGTTERYDLEGLILHYGWRAQEEKDNNKYKKYTNLWVNSTWVKGFLAFAPSHQHNDNLYDGSNHVVKCQDCGRTAYNDVHTYNTYKPICLEAMQFSKTEHFVECDCGDVIKAPHTITYFTTDYSVEEEHVVYCNECKLHYEEEHFFKKPGTACLYCKYLPNEKNSQGVKDEKDS